MTSLTTAFNFSEGFLKYITLYTFQRLIYLELVNIMAMTFHGIGLMYR